MRGQRFTINSRKYDFSLRRSWSAVLIERSAQHMRLEGVFDQDISHRDLGLVAKGTRSIETFFPDRWYNFFAFFEPQGELRNHYINISMPPEIGPDTIDYIDLDVDVIVWPDGRTDVLDLDEFEENVEVYKYPSDVIERVTRLKDQIASRPADFITSLVS